MKTLLKTTLAFGLMSVFVATAMAGDQIRYNYVPDTISPEAQKALAAIYDANAYARVFPAADDLDGWKKTHTEGEQHLAFLSTSFRLFQALDAAGQDTKLDVYEGMWHVFQTSPGPETEVSLKKISAFLNRHLKI